MTTNSTPDERALHIRLAASAHRDDPADQQARTDRIARAATDRFADQVDPERKLKPEERARRARNARRAYYTSLALHSSRARAARRADDA